LESVAERLVQVVEEGKPTVEALGSRKRLTNHAEAIRSTWIPFRVTHVRPASS